MLLTHGAKAQEAQYEEEYDYGYDTYDVEEADRTVGFIEAQGGYGFQVGNLEYVPDGAGGDWKHPLVNGPAVGGTIGFHLAPNIALVANYEWTKAWSRKGEVPGILDEVQGKVDYHTVTAGFRLREPAGPGAVRAELGAGVVLPFETELELDYGAGLAQAGITGRGTQIENYNIGIAGHAQLGYEIPIGDVFYIALDLKLKVAQSSNEGKTTELRNFVTDFEAFPPTAVTTNIRHDDGAAQPTTYSLQSGRGMLTLGARF